MPTTTTSPATLDDLYRVEGKVELVAGRIVVRMPSGHRPSRMTLKIAVRLEPYSEADGSGFADSDRMGFALIPPLVIGRLSFLPDAAYDLGPVLTNEMRFVEGTPDLAVELRSGNDCGPAAEVEMQAKRADYFGVGMVVVWDVNPETKPVKSHRGDPTTPFASFRSGGLADAKRAAPGSRVAVVALFQ